jgi:hypothetical protein
MGRDRAAEITSRAGLSASHIQDLGPGGVLDPCRRNFVFFFDSQRVSLDVFEDWKASSYVLSIILSV